MFTITLITIEKQNIINIIKEEIGDYSIYNSNYILLVFFILRFSACINGKV